MAIDCYSHFITPDYLRALQARYKDAGLAKRLGEIRALWDIDARGRVLERFPDVRQVVTPGLPGPEQLAGPEDSPALARLANDGLAATVAAHSDLFAGFVAALPLNNVPAAITEMDRAIGDLGARGIEIKTNVNGRALDDPEFLPLFQHAVEHHDVTIWMHPVRPAGFTDYAAEPRSRYEIWQVMGWPYETTAAMARIVFSGLFDRFPTMRILTHHCGGMLPFFAGRAETLWAQLGSRTTDEDYSRVLAGLQRPFMDYFRMFYGDTVLGGSVSALRCGLDFFGPERVVFASDAPFDPEGGPMFIRDGLASIDALALSGADRHALLEGTARRLLKLQ